MFISYGREDREFVDQLAADLRKLNLDVWHDVRLDTGDDLSGTIEKELEDADFFLVVLTETSHEKDWVRKEYHKALDLKEKNKRPVVIPILKGDVSLPMQLILLAYADFSQSYEYGMTFLRRRFLRSQEPDDEVRPAPTRVPPPYGEVSRPGPPSSMPVFSVSVVERNQSAPVDLGTVWGLQRSSFIGVCAGTNRQEVYDGLNNLERALFETGNEEPDAARLSSRWWLQIDPKLYPNGPQSVADVWRSLKDKSDDRAWYLEYETLPGSVIPGFLIDLDATDKEELKQSIESVRLWCDALANKMFPDRDISIVVQVNDGENPQTLAKSVLNELSSLNGTLPLEAFYSGIERVSHQKEPLNANGSYHKRSPLEAAPADTLGGHFCSWILQIHSSEENWPKLEQQPEIIKLFRVLKGSTTPNDHKVPKLSHPDDVVADLDQITEILGTQGRSAGSDDIDRQFLELVRDCLPEHLPALVWAYRNSSRVQAWRQALLMAIKENLIDSGAAGSESFLQSSLKVGSEPDEAYRGLLHADAGFRDSIVDRLVQRLLRSYMTARSAETESLLKRVVAEPGLGPATKAVCKLFLGQMTLREFLRSEGREAHLIALHAGCDFAFSLAEIDYVDIDNVDLWLLMASLPASKKRIAELLKLENRERAVFGLITADEWQGMRSDQGFMTKLAAARQERALIFRS